MTICDFCSSENVRWTYPARDFSIGLVGSEGSWAACDDCHHLIESNDRDGLLRRSIRTWPTGGIMPADALPILRETHRQFFVNRTGPAQAVAIA